MFLSATFVQGQDSTEIVVYHEKLFGIFPTVDNKVAYNDNISPEKKLARDSFYLKSKAFFADNSVAKYDLASDDSEKGELLYEATLRRSMFSSKSDVHFSVKVNYSDAGCSFDLFEVIFAYSRSQYSGNVRTGTIENAVNLENITFDKGEFTKKYCEKLNTQFLTIMANLKAALN
jgi:hypothetical protein